MPITGDELTPGITRWSRACTPDVSRGEHALAGDAPLLEIAQAAGGVLEPVPVGFDGMDPAVRRELQEVADQRRVARRIADRPAAPFDADDRAAVEEDL